ncbi:hypothetical protein GDO81_024397 [Engystomops pustulosus]|uniref:Uncharacterized protein n=1 Tax=Engystomops pustulosus TaxID=76066 RepID=A0AAV6YK24_ENGPU|nr:hypothetical protein GDO81_024397 [Engystomops pustulosus]
MVIPSDPNCWEMFIIQIRRRKITTRSSMVLRTPHRGSEMTSKGEDKHMMAPNKQMTIRRQKIHTSPPIVKTLRRARCRRDGRSYR